METYDLYQFGSNPDIIVGWQKFECESDKAAKVIALTMALLGTQELWHDHDLVKRWTRTA